MARLLPGGGTVPLGPTHPISNPNTPRPPVRPDPQGEANHRRRDRMLDIDRIIEILSNSSHPDPQEEEERRRRERRKKRRWAIRLVMFILFSVSCIPAYLFLGFFYSGGILLSLFSLGIATIPFFIIKKKGASIPIFIAFLLICFFRFGFSFFFIAFGVFYLTSYILRFFLSPDKEIKVVLEIITMVTMAVGMVTIIWFIWTTLPFYWVFQNYNLAYIAPYIPEEQSSTETIPNNITTIGERAYANKGLKSIVFDMPSKVTSIGNGAFRDNQLTSITIPDSVRTIGINAFANNPVTSVAIGANVTLNWSGNVGVLGQATGFNGAYERNHSRAGTYTRPNVKSQNWTFSASRTQQQSATTLPIITINAIPSATRNVTTGNINGSFSVSASVNQNVTLRYQWFRNTSASNTGGTAIGNETRSSFTIPKNLTAGTYFYFCEVSASGTVSVRSNVARVNVSSPAKPQQTRPQQPPQQAVPKGEFDDWW